MTSSDIKNLSGELENGSLTAKFTSSQENLGCRPDHNRTII